MKKALLVTTVSGFVPQFEMNNVRLLQQMGYEIHYASNYHIPSYGKDNSRLDGTGIVRHQIDFVRSPYSLKNWKAYKQLKSLMEKEHFQLVHCHTPMGGVVARLAAHATGTVPVFYTAHGFHFYKGAPLVNWLFYYPVEKWLSRYTDQLVCINEEDYKRASKFHARYVDYIPGVGIDLKKIRYVSETDIDKKKAELGIPTDKKIVLSAGELIKRKNHESVIRAITRIQDESLLYVVCGQGELAKHLADVVKKMMLEDRVFFAGYRSDIFEIYQIADLYVFPSFQEGLPMALLEAMANGLPVVCSDIRGSRDLMDENTQDDMKTRWRNCDGGIMVDKADDIEAYAEAIEYFLKDPDELKACGKRNALKAEKFSRECVEGHMRNIYKRYELPNYL
ncbi:glycosyltransferase family 4 protein [Lacrimispora sp.]|uniref:glycosyltransferase family 4 protein n=1 Tax=Lacrimispora sp. TaxID=2719234 RepID=UPI0028A9F029|nr:glycosyltransferase family 4 protein [Lacrimispora sp.]